MTVNRLLGITSFPEAFGRTSVAPDSAQTNFVPLQVRCQNVRNPASNLATAAVEATRLPIVFSGKKTKAASGPP